MYKVYCDGYTLHDPALNDVRFQLLSPVVTQEANRIGSFTFVLPSMHTNANSIHRLASVIEAYDDNKLIFRGRPLNDQEDWDKSRTIVCESDLAKLNDSILRPYTFTGTVEAYLQQLVTWHNAQVPAAKQFTVGTVTVVSNENTQHTITRENSTYPKTWNELEDKLLSKFEGYLFVTWTGTTNRIDYLADSPYHCTQAITFRENLLDFGRERKGEDIITRLIPLGAKDEQTGLRLTVKSVNNDQDYITDTTAAGIYGIINDKAVFDEVTSAAELFLRGQAYLAENTSGTTSVTLTAADLHLMDSSIASFDFLSYVTVNDPAHDISGEMLVTKKTTNLVDPSQGKMTIGKQSTGISQYYAGTAAEVSQIPEMYATKSEVTTIQTTIQSEIDQQENKISLVVAESSGSYVIRSAQIVAAINQENGSTVYIDADHIRVTGQMVVSAINGGSTTIDGSKITTGTMNASAIGAGTIDASVIAVTNLNASNITTGRLLVKDSNNYVLFDADIATNTVAIAGFTVVKNMLQYKYQKSSGSGALSDKINELRVNYGNNGLIENLDYWALSGNTAYSGNRYAGIQMSADNDNHMVLLDHDHKNDPSSPYSDSSVNLPTEIQFTKSDANGNTLLRGIFGREGFEFVDFSRQNCRTAFDLTNGLTMQDGNKYLDITASGPTPYSGYAQVNGMASGTAYHTITSFALDPGTYLIQVHFAFAANTSGRRVGIVSYSQDSSSQIASMWRASAAPVNGENTFLNICGMVKPNSTTTFYLNAMQNSGSGLNTFASYRYVRLA